MKAQELASCLNSFAHFYEEDTHADRVHRRLPTNPQLEAIVDAICR